MVEKSGNPVIPMRELAAELGIKAPSLYNHEKNADEVAAEVSRYAAFQLRDTLVHAIEGKERDEAVLALVAAYRNYAKERRGLYSVTFPCLLCLRMFLEKRPLP